MQIVVELSRLRHNIRRIRSILPQRYCAVVKAQAYGHGVSVVPYIDPVVDCFLVASYSEAEEVAFLTQKPVLVLAGEPRPLCGRSSANVVPAVYSARDAEWAIRYGCKKFSVAVNTGMNRLGADENELGRIVAVCKANDIKPWSVYSHIYGGISSAGEQSNEFERLTQDALLRGNRHLYSSCALDLRENGHFDMVRIGIAMYGFASGFETALKARAKILSIFRVERGRHVGYGDFTLDRDCVVAAVGLGYADGLRRSDRPLYLTVRGKKCRVLGSPCMDVTMIDVSDVACRVGEFAYMIADKSDVEYLAKVYDTIVYEVLTGLNGRSERVYV